MVFLIHYYARDFLIRACRSRIGNKLSSAIKKKKVLAGQRSAVPWGEILSWKDQGGSGKKIQERQSFNFGLLATLGKTVQNHFSQTF